jgi:hypothetical protein
MKSALMRACALGVVLTLAGCGGSNPPAAESEATAPGGEAAAAGAAPVAGGPAAAPAAAAPASAADLLKPPSWFPADWDQNAYRGAEPGYQPDLIHNLRQELMQTAPFTIWAVAHDTLIDEKFEPVWVWWTALRSCERGIQMSQDLAGEFGDRERGKAALTTARNELKTFAATQPAEITMYFTANLGQWNETTGNFPLTNLGRAYNINALEVEKVADFAFVDGAEVLLYSDGKGQTISQLRASISNVQCVAPDQQTYYKFSRDSQWYVVFGEAERGMGGQINWKSRPPAPSFNMTRDQAAAFAQRNPERKVMVAVTFGPGGDSFVQSIDHSAIRAKLSNVTITDALDNSVLATKAY